MSSSRVIVTGGAGFIGSHLVAALLARGHQVLVIDDLSYGKKENVGSPASLEVRDIRDEKLGEIFDKFKPELVYHLAAQKNVRTSLVNPALDASINIMGALNVLQAALQNNVGKFIFVSTCGVYGSAQNLPTAENDQIDPLSPYILNKFVFENYLQILAGAKLPWVALRLANVYGPRQDPYGEAGVIAVFLQNLINNKTLFINGDGEQTRDFIYIADVVSALVSASEQGQGIYNIGTGSKTSLNKLIAELEKVTNKKAILENRQAIEGEVRHSVLDSSLAQRELAWFAQYDLAQGLAETYDWFKTLA